MQVNSSLPHVPTNITILSTASSDQALVKEALHCYKLKNYVSAFNQLTDLANKGDLKDAQGQYVLGQIYRQGLGDMAPDDQKAVAWYQQAAGQGYADAQNNLGWMYENGRGVEQDNQQAVAWFKKAAEQGDATAQNNLGWMYAHGCGVARDDQQAVVWYRQAADQEDATAQNNLGWMYAQGRGVARDDQQAVAWYQQAADQGQATAQYNLGLMYEKGRGIEQDDQKAVAWCQKAADQRQAHAQYYLGCMYQEGRGVKQGIAMAKVYYTEAGSKGHVMAMIKLAKLYESDKSASSDEAAAIWAKNAVEVGNNQEARSLRRSLYIEGRGLAGDPMDALHVLEDLSKTGEFLERPKAQALLPQVHTLISIALKRGDDNMKTALEKGYLQGKGLGYDPMSALRYLEETAGAQSAEKREKSNQAREVLKRFLHLVVEKKSLDISDRKLWREEDL